MRLIARTVLCLAFAAAACAALAQERACVDPPGVADIQQAVVKFPPRDRGLLWRLEKDGRTSWLYGTIHVGRLEWLAPGPRVMRAIGASDAMVLELDMSKPEEFVAALPKADPAVASRVLANGLDARLATQLKKACVPDAARAFRPAMQVVTASAVAGRAEGLHPELGIDLLLTGMAPHLGKKIVALETAADQLKALMPASEAEEREMILEALEQLEGPLALSVLKRMALAWERGDARELATYSEWCDCMKTELDKAMMKRLLDERNPPMADKLAQLHAGGTRFFAAVGALHMTGGQSLLKLLADRGFDVQRVDFER